MQHEVFVHRSFNVREPSAHAACAIKFSINTSCQCAPILLTCSARLSPRDGRRAALEALIWI